MRRLLVLVLAVAGLALLPASAETQRPARRPAQQSDEAVLAAYRLSETTLARFIKASRGLAAIPRQEPDDADDEEDDEEDEDDSDDAEDEDDDEEEDDPSIDEMATFYENKPEARRAIVAAGLTSREYVVFMLTLFQSGMAAWLVEQQGWEKLPPGIARENVVFYQRHKAELDTVTTELRGRQPH